MNVTLDTFFPAKYGGNIMSEILCEPAEVCNDNEILFKGLVTGWLGLVALIMPSTSSLILPKLQGSAEAAAASCNGMGNNTCGVRWYPKKWDGWNGMEEEIAVTNVLASALYSTKQTAPVTSSTGGNSTSDPNAGTGDNTDSGSTESKITTGDKAGASILTIAFVGMWGGMIAWMVIGG